MAGEAKRKEERAQRPVTFDFGAPAFFVGRDDRVAFEMDTGKDSILARAGKLLMRHVVRGAFPRGVDWEEGYLWARWLEAIEPEASDVAEVTLGMIEWYQRHLDERTNPVPSDMSQWRIAQSEYIKALRDEVAAAMAAEAGEHPAK